MNTNMHCSKWMKCLVGAAATLVLLGPSAAAMAQDSLALGQVYDDDGAFVGTLVDHGQSGSQGTVFREIDGNIVELFVNNRFSRIEPLGDIVWFSGAGCTGQAYAEASDPGVPALAGILAGGGLPNVFYFAPAGTVAVAATVLSSASFNGACGGVAPEPDAFYPVSPSPDPLAFTPPFVVQSFVPSITTPAAVPGLERWGLVGLGLALAVVAVVVLRRLA